MTDSSAQSDSQLRGRLEEIRVQIVEHVRQGMLAGGVGQAGISLEIGKLEEEAARIRRQLDSGTGNSGEA